MTLYERVVDVVRLANGFTAEQVDEFAAHLRTLVPALHELRASYRSGRGTVQVTYTRAVTEDWGGQVEVAAVGSVDIASGGPAAQPLSVAVPCGPTLVTTGQAADDGGLRPMREGDSMGRKT